MSVKGDLVNMGTVQAAFHCVDSDGASMVKDVTHDNGETTIIINGPTEEINMWFALNARLGLDGAQGGFKSLGEALKIS